MPWSALIGSAGIILFAYWVRRVLPIWRSTRWPRFLSRVSWAEPAAAGSTVISVIVPACNEGETIRPCLESLLAQDAADVEILAVDDRSTDATGRIMDELAAGHASLRVIHILELPTGWLGKNHANHAAAAVAQGSWLLFTDGDVLFQASALRRAVHFAEAEGLDHLCLLPGLICHGYLEKAACCFFGLLFSVAMDLEEVRNPLRPAAACGIGAFNLVRAGAYGSIGGHIPLRMEIADDVKLGKLLKRGGFVSDVLAGWPDVSVRWQQGFRGVIRGLEKNAFAGVEFRTARLATAVAALVGLGVVPLIGALAAPGWARAGYITWLAAEIGTLAAAARLQGFSWTVGLACPVACVGLAWAMARSAILTLCWGGVSWRGTFYPLGQLRNGLA